MNFLSKLLGKKASSHDTKSPASEIMDDLRMKIVEVDNSSPEDNWITNTSNISVSVSCEEMFGAFTVDLDPEESRRVTFDVEANVYPADQYSFDDLKYHLGRSEKWEVRLERGQLVLVKVDG